MMRNAIVAICLVAAHAGMANVTIPWQDGANAGEISAQVTTDDPGSLPELVMSERDTFVVQPTDMLLPRVSAYVPRASAEVQVTPRVPMADGRPGFSMVIKLIADSAQAGKFATPELIQKGIEDAAATYLAESVEQKVTLKVVKYGGRQGWYTVLTDKKLVGIDQSRPNDFHYAAVGMIRLSDDSVLEFRLFVDDLASKEFFRPLEYALKLAKPLPATRPTK